MTDSTRLYIGTVDGIRTLDVDRNRGEVRQVGGLRREHAAARIAVSVAKAGRVYLTAYESGVWEERRRRGVVARAEVLPRALCPQRCRGPRGRGPGLRRCGAREPISLLRWRRVVGGV